jgi:hypothetical protein
MPSSTSSLSAKPRVSVVIGAGAPEASLEACLAALEPQHEGAEVLVLEAVRSTDRLRERFSWASFHDRPGALVPELWRDGIEQAQGLIVALTIAQMIPESNWIEALLREHQDHDAVGGGIDAAPGLSLVDYAEYLCRYARDMPPFEPNERDDLPGDNASYKRALLVEEAEHLRDGFWEPVIHPVLRRRGARFWHTPSMLVHQGRSCGFGAFARQRCEHGRRYGHQRGEQFSPARNLIGVLAAPAVPFLMTARVFRNVFGKGRNRMRALAALPLVFALNVVWAYAEARGHLDMVTR